MKENEIETGTQWLESSPGGYSYKLSENEDFIIYQAPNGRIGEDKIQSLTPREQFVWKHQTDSEALSKFSTPAAITRLFNAAERKIESNAIIKSHIACLKKLKADAKKANEAYLQGYNEGKENYYLFNTQTKQVESTTLMTKGQAHVQNGKLQIDCNPCRWVPEGASLN